MFDLKQKGNAKIENKPHDYKITLDTAFAVTEAYKVIRTNLQFALAARDGNTVVISSPTPGDGKSTTAANLAITLGQTSAKVLLIDADLRKPTLHKIFQLDNSNGMSRLLVGLETVGEAIKKNVELGLDILTSGPLPPNPSELVGSLNMSDLIERMSQHYDYVIIDSPPVNMVTEAILLAVKCLGILLAARQNITTYPELKKTIQTINLAKANLLGVVITDLQSKNKGYGKRKYAYKYEYGYETEPEME